VKILNEETLQKLASEFQRIEEGVLSIASTEEVSGLVEEGATKTFDKVTRMRDLYIEGHWDEDSEVLEWMGFYTGASLVHWYLVAGAGKALASSSIESASRDAIAFYRSLFSADETYLQKIGAKLAS
jgi:hypothetical protein